MVLTACLLSRRLAELVFFPPSNPFHSPRSLVDCVFSACLGVFSAGHPGVGFRLCHFYERMHVISINDACHFNQRQRSLFLSRRSAPVAVAVAVTIAVAIAVVLMVAVILPVAVLLPVAVAVVVVPSAAAPLLLRLRLLGVHVLTTVRALVREPALARAVPLVAVSVLEWRLVRARVAARGAARNCASTS